MRKYIFRPVNSIEEAEKEAAKMGIRAFYSGLDLDIANTCNECIANTLNTFPKVRRQLKVAGNAQLMIESLKKELEPFGDSITVKDMDEDARTMLYPRMLFKTKADKIVGRSTGIYINSDTLNNCLDVKEYYKERVLSGHSPSGLENAGIKAIIDHEMGHIIDYCYDIRSDKNIVKFFAEAEKISSYASNSILEFIAECWTEYNNSKMPSDISKEVALAMLNYK